MCGIFGFSLKEGGGKGGPGGRLGALVTSLAVLNDTRGGHSWGVHSPGDDAPVKGMGDLATAATLRKVLARGHVACHTRMASTGKVSLENAHPFTCEGGHLGKVVGMHNGCVSNHQELNSRYGRDCDVDSLHLFLHLAEGRPLDDVEAYGAVAYHVAGEAGTRLCKFNRGELAVAELKKGGVVWSSDEDHLRASLKASGLRYTMYDLKERVVYLAEGGELYDTGERLQFAPYVSKYTWQGKYEDMGSYLSSLEDEEEEKKLFDVEFEDYYDKRYLVE